MKSHSNERIIYDLLPLLSELDIPRFRLEKAIWDFVTILNIIEVDTSELEIRVEFCYVIPKTLENIEVEFIVQKDGVK